MERTRPGFDLRRRTQLTRHAFTLLAAGLALVTIPASAQEAAAPVAEDFEPSSLNQPGQEYPQVNSQGYVRFRVTAPGAQNVRATLGLGGQGGTVLHKTEDGIWVGT